MSASVDLGYVLDRTDPGGELPVEDDSRLASVPDDLPARAAASDISDPMLPLFVRPAEKRALDLISDWPWISLQELAGLMGVAPQRASQLVNPLEGFGLAARLQDAGRRLALTDRGPLPAGAQGPHLGGRGEEAVEHRPGGTPKAPSSGATSPAEGPASCSGTSSTPPPSTASWPRCPRRRRCWGGRSSRSTRRAGPHDTSGTTTGCAPSTPTPSASCARAGPIGPSSWSGSAAPCGPRPCRTASRPICATTHLTGPSTTTGAGPPSLVVFDDEIAQTHFLRVAREEMRAEQVTVPLWVSHREAIDALGPLGGAWRTPAEWESPNTLPSPVNLDKPAGA